MSERLMRAALDTNVLVYAKGVGDPPRCDQARSLVARMPLEQIVLPAQTLGELYRVLTGKAGFDADRARMALLTFEIADSTHQLHKFSSARGRRVVFPGRARIFSDRNIAHSM